MSGNGKVAAERIDHVPVPSNTWVRSDDPSTRAPALTEGSCSGLRPTGVLEGATGLPVGLHMGPGSWRASSTP